MAERYQHIKRGTTYEVIARGKLQTAKPLTDYAELVAYRCEETGDVWFRAPSEFTPDRFAVLPGIDKPDLRDLVTKQAQSAREVFSGSCDHTKQGIDYLEQLLLSTLTEKG